MSQNILGKEPVITCRSNRVVGFYPHYQAKLQVIPYNYRQEQTTWWEPAEVSDVNKALADEGRLGNVLVALAPGLCKRWANLFRVDKGKRFRKINRRIKTPDEALDE
jgi:hypothetical protein